MPCSPAEVKERKGLVSAGVNAQVAPPHPPTVHEDEGGDGQGHVQGQVYAAHQESEQLWKKMYVHDYLVLASHAFVFCFNTPLYFCVSLTSLLGIYSRY